MKTQSEKDKFQKIIESATLKEVTLIFSKCQSYFHYSIINPPQTKLEFAKTISKHNISDSNNKTKDVFLSTQVHFEVTGKSKEDITDFKIKKDSPLFSISVSYVIVYIIKNIGDLDDEMLKFFSENNAYFNVYPYLREYITHMSTRLNIPPVTLPLLKPNNLLKQQKTEKPVKTKSK